MGPTNCDSEQMERSNGSSKESPRLSYGSEDIMIRDWASQPVAHLEHHGGNANVTKCSKIRIGPEFHTVTRNIENIKVDKENKGLPFHCFIWDVAKNTTKAKSLSWIAAILILITCILLIVYFTAGASDWYIDRRKWGAAEYNKTTTIKDHSRLVIIAHTVDQSCTTYIECKTVVKNLQSQFLTKLNYDIPYNFLIGGDGRVYEGRGWSIRGAHSLNYNSCSVGIGFIGDYRYINVTDLQQERAHMLFEEGVKNGKLHSNFHVLGHLDLRPTLSPGENLYNVIKTWPNYDHDNMYKSLSCQQIDDL